MYELVNTSVPNGLIAGTHGFSTVAMTKGMPDAIRTRVENFCAYPHRTSAHDATYFAENPVNWFHLTLPNGDHVLGRTAPADFDYTGRTNRLSRTLVFGSREMPGAGGASVLSAAAQMLSEPWTGDPKYLADNKALAGQLRFLDRSKTPSPSNWIAQFGANGDDLARRFAALVAKNLSVGGRSVYFKLSAAADASGTRVLGLFADLIDLLPDDVAPFVTFSSFSPCVPSGVTCHLRGVFDSDRAFDVASATQPWVDCEHGRIVHAELLPEPLAPAVAKLKAGLKVENAAEDKISSQPRFLPGNQRRSASASATQASRYAAQATSETDTFLWKCIAGFTVAVTALISVAIWYVMSQRQDVEDRSAESESVSESPSQTNVQSEPALVAKNMPKEASTQEHLPQKPKEDNTTSVDGKEGVRDSVQSEKERLAAKNKQEEKIKQDKAESAKRQQEEAERVQKIHNRPLSELATITRVIEKGNGLLDALPDRSSRMSLTNENRLVAYYLVDKKVKQSDCRFVYVPPRNAIGARQESWRRVCEDTLDEVLKGKGSEDCVPWIVWRIIDEEPANERIYWEWNRRDITGKLFNGRRNVGLAEKLFGDTQAYEFWKRHQKKSCFSLVFENQVLYWRDKELQLSDVAKLQMKRDKENLDKIREERTSLQNKCNVADSEFTNLETAYRSIDTIHANNLVYENKKSLKKNPKEEEKRVQKVRASVKEILVKYGVKEEDFSEKDAWEKVFAPVPFKSHVENLKSQWKKKKAECEDIHKRYEAKKSEFERLESKISKGEEELLNAVITLTIEVDGPPSGVKIGEFVPLKQTR